MEDKHSGLRDKKGQGELGVNTHWQSHILLVYPRSTTQI